MSDENDTGKENGNERNHGVQPLDALLTSAGVNNHDLVAASTEPMTHKAVARARKGRQLTPKMKVRMTEALNALSRARGEQAAWRVRDLFNY